jgi:serine phosphatase RsbU (regulator of sigma subunit)
MRRTPTRFTAIAVLALLVPALHAQNEPAPSPGDIKRELRQERRAQKEQARKQSETDQHNYKDKLGSDKSIDDFHIGHYDPGKPPPPPLQPIPAQPFGDRLDLTKTWQFHPGSNPGYASPTWDDHDWTQVDTTRPLIMSGYLNLNEVWYRRHILLAPGSHSLAITIADFGGSYRVYANGQELGGHGKMSDRGNYLLAASATFPIPDTLLTQPELVIAIHAFVGTIDRATFTLSDGISKTSAVYLGPANVLYRDQQTYFQNGLSESPAVLVLWALLCLLAIALTTLIPKVPAYPLLAIYAGGHLISLLLMDFGRFNYAGRDDWVAIPVLMALMASELAALEFARNVAGSKRRVWFTTVEIVYILCYTSLLPANLGILSFLIYGILWRAGYYLLLTVTVLLIATGVRRHKRDAYILAGFFAGYLVYLATFWALHYIDFDYVWLTRLADGFVARFQPSPTGDLAIVAAFLTIVILRTLRLVRERAAIATEIEAARTMQQLLLARSSEPTPGFLVETAYIPAGEVGGDFFLITTIHETQEEEAGLFAIVGDVSGKGLRAAMRVSMILGVLRREPSRDPAIVLCSLNEALLSDRSDTGFTTACCVRIRTSGHFTVANAGHISPYLATAGSIGPIRTAETGSSHELETPPALPLGLAPAQTYETVSGRLLPGQRLVLLSDGIPEARSHKGELYGFDRLTALTLNPAAEIARTAQAFGQEDDITVLTIAALTPTTNQPPPPPAAPRPPTQPPPPPIPAR